MAEADGNGLPIDVYVTSEHYECNLAQMTMESEKESTPFKKF